MKAILLVVAWGAIGFATGRFTNPTHVRVVEATPVVRDVVRIPPVLARSVTAPPALHVPEVLPTGRARVEPPKLADDAGGVSGTIRDARGQRLEGATVIFSGGQQSQTAITDERGEYRLALPRGTYTMTIYYGDLVMDEKLVNASDVTPASYDAELPDVTPQPELIVDPPSPEAPIDGDNYIRNIPTGRTFGSVLGAAAGSQPVVGCGAME